MEVRDGDDQSGHEIIFAPTRIEPARIEEIDDTLADAALELANAAASLGRRLSPVTLERRGEPKQGGHSVLDQAPVPQITEGGHGTKRPVLRTGFPKPGLRDT